ncbi:MAG: hypothetical protein EBU57_02660 [Alphaproteobacteria bacterium]|nr:hypothetical protein [Alphaproteobacteria bacterium]
MTRAIDPGVKKRTKVFSGYDLQLLAQRFRVYQVLLCCNHEPSEGLEKGLRAHPLGQHAKYPYTFGFCVAVSQVACHVPAIPDQRTNVERCLCQILLAQFLKNEGSRTIATLGAHMLYGEPCT